MNMKKQYIYIFMVCLSAVFSCVRVDESLLGGEQEQVEMIELSIDATIEQTADTKTALEGSLSDASMRTVWIPSDSIGVVAWRSSMGNNEKVAKFRTDITENAATASFEGKVQASSKYYAFYPYDSSLSSVSGNFVFTLPQVQNYVEGSFDPEAAPMVAKADYGKSFEFQNLCGLLALHITGEEAVKAITFIGKDEAGNSMPMSGTFMVDMAYTESPTIQTAASSGHPELIQYPNHTSVTLNCAAPVQLGEEAVPFYFVLPPATYSSFMIMIYTADGKVMVKEATKPITIERSHVKPTAALQYAENIYYVNLSDTGWANSYIVSEAGMYSFDADIIGNGDFGIIEDVEFHTTDASINPYSAEILWQDRDEVIASATYVDGKVRFYALGNEGNALVAVKDGSGNILWSWHIWVVDDQIIEHTYTNNEGKSFVVMDRYLGSISAEVGDEGGALYYQWGRKDPFKFNGSGLDASFRGQFSNLSEAISAPTHYPQGNDWVTDISTSLWSKDMKTIYDPCPEGWRVPSSEIWSGIRKLQDLDSNGYGIVFGFSDTDSFWYPDAPRFNNYGNVDGSYTCDQTEVWTAEYGVSYFLKYNGNHTNSRTRCDAYPIRCMKDE